MTDRVNALTVVLDADYRTDDVEQIVKAISMVRGVVKVDMHVARSMSDHVARTRVRFELQEALLQVLRDGK